MEVTVEIFDFLPYKRLLFELSLFMAGLYFSFAAVTLQERVGILSWGEAVSGFLGFMMVFGALLSFLIPADTTVLLLLSHGIVFAMVVNVELPKASSIAEAGVWAILAFACLLLAMSGVFTLFIWLLPRLSW